MGPITGERPAPEPMRVDVVKLVIGGTALWFVGWVVFLAVGGRDEAMWTCLAGWLLGLVGLRLAWTAQKRAQSSD